MRLTVVMVTAMMAIVASANWLVQFPINDWLTWGALTYPVSYFVTDLTNRLKGAAAARKVVWFGFALAVAVSVFLAGPRIALASGTAFLCSQMLDIKVFDRLLRRGWWQPPLFSSAVGSAVDTFLFFVLAFYATGVPWVTLAIGDYGVKLAIALLMLMPWWIALRKHSRNNKGNHIESRRHNRKPVNH